MAKSIEDLSTDVEAIVTSIEDVVEAVKELSDECIPKGKAQAMLKIAGAGLETVAKQLGDYVEGLED